MNGARTTHMWKGYLLTALAAGLLLAASPGVVSAQEPRADAELDLLHGSGGIDMDAPASVLESGSGEITVSIRAAGPRSATDNVGAITTQENDVEVEITLAVAGVANPRAPLATVAEQEEVDFDEARGSDGDVVYAETSGVNDEAPAMGEITITFDVEADTAEKLYEAVFFFDTGSDTDAEDENVNLDVTMISGFPAGNTPNANVLPDVHIGIDDDETQLYVMALARTTRTPTEGETFDVDIEADPPHVDSAGRLTLQIVDEDGKRNLNYRSGPRNLDSGLSEISIVFQAAVPKLVASKYTTSGVRRPSEL